MNTVELTSQQSKNINLLKGLSIIFVVFIHADLRSMISAYMDLTMPVNVYMETLTRTLVDNAVPMFFFVSGFLFFLRKDTYANKFKSRFKTLFVPYVIWCLIGFLIPFVIQRILGLEHLYSGKELKLIKDFAPMDYARMFWDLRNGNPILSTLWFLRDLIVFVALTPAIALLVRYLKSLFLVFILAAYFFIQYSVAGFNVNSFCWFALGAYFSLGGVNCWESIEYINLRHLLTVWIVMTSIAVWTFAADFHHQVFMLFYRIIHFMTIYRLIAYLTKSQCNLALMYKISFASFFIYLFHEPWMGYIAQIGMKAIQPQGILLYISPIVLVMVTICYSYAAYLILKKVSPRFLNVITGLRMR